MWPDILDFAFSRFVGPFADCFMNSNIAIDNRTFDIIEGFTTVVDKLTKDKKPNNVRVLFYQAYKLRYFHLKSLSPPVSEKMLLITIAKTPSRHAG